MNENDRRNTFSNGESSARMRSSSNRNSIVKSNTVRIKKNVRKDDNKTFCINQFENIQCSIVKYGAFCVTQPKFFCKKCDKFEDNPMCEVCFNLCHKDCLKESDKLAVIEQSTKDLFPFICSCGRYNKHMINEKLSNNTVCIFRKLDSYLEYNKSLYCKKCETILCSICYSECHKNCSYEEEDIVLIEEEKSNECRCTHYNHAEYPKDEFIFGTINSKRFIDLKVVENPIQYMNLVFSSKEIFLSGLKEFTTKFFIRVNENIDFEDESIKSDRFNQNLHNMIDDYYEMKSIVTYISYMFSGKLYNYYFSDEILNLFSYENLKNILSIKHSDKSVPYFLEFQSNIFFILFNLHIKSDFQNVKSFTVSDFMNSNFMDRFNKKFTYFNRNLYSNKIYDKYINDSIEDLLENVIENIFLKLLETDDFKINLLICLKFISFTLKRMMVFKKLDHLIVLVDKLHRTYFTKSIRWIIVESNKEENNQVFDQEIPKYDIDIISYFIKIAYLLTLEINDRQIYEFLINKSKKLAFAQKDSEYNTKLFEIIIKNSSFISNKKIKDCLNHKIKKTFYRSLLLFTVTDNEYLYKIRKFKQKDLESKMDTLRRIQNLRESDIYNSLLKVNNNDFVQSFKNDLEKLVKYYFLKMDVVNKFKTDVNEDNTESFKTFDTILKEFSENIENANNSYNKKHVSNTEYDESKYLKHSKYLARLKLYLCECPEFSFVNNSKFDDNIFEFVDDIIFGNLDDIISIFISFKYLKVDDVNKVIRILFLYLFNGNGIRYILSGKTLNRLLLLLKDYPNQLTDFFYFLRKGAKLFEVMITYHKLSYILMEKLINYLNTEISDSSLVKHFTIINKTFYSLSFLWNFENFEKIKKTILNIFINKGFLDPEKFDYTFKDDSIFLSNNLILRTVQSIKRKYEKNLTEEEVHLLNNDDIKPEIIEQPINVDQEYEKRRHLKKLYFSFFKVISFNTYYRYDEYSDDHIKLDNFIKNHNFFEKLLNSKNCFIRYRTIIFNFLIHFYFIDIINSGNKKSNSYLTTEEFIYYNQKIHKTDPRLIMFENLDENMTENDLENKISHSNSIVQILNILKEEMICISDIISSKRYEVYELKDYLKNIIFNVKHISDIFYVTDISKHINLYYYKLAREFLVRSQEIKKVIENFNQSNVMENIKINHIEQHSILENKEFDIYNKEKVYEIMVHEIDAIYKISEEINKKYTLDYFLSNYDLQTELVYSVPGIKFNPEYDVFYGYQETECKKIESSDLVELEKIYHSQFNDIYKSCFYKSSTKISSDVTEDFRNKLLRLFIQNIKDKDDEDNDYYLIIILQIITRMLYYDTRPNQEALYELLFDNDINDYDFFKCLIPEFEKSIKFIMFTSKNFYQNEYFTKSVNLKVKLMLQFIQLLSEGFYTEFDDIIFTIKKELYSENNSENIPFYKKQSVEDVEKINYLLTEKSIFDKIFYNLKEALDNINIKKDLEGESPYDKLIVFADNIVKFLTEYIQGFSLNSRKILSYYQNKFFVYGFHDIIFHRISSNDQNCFVIRRKLLLKIKILLITLIKNIMDEMDNDCEVDLKDEINKIKIYLNPIKIFEEIIFYLNEIAVLKIKGNKDKKDFDISEKDSFIKLIDFYINNEQFKDSLQLNYVIQSYLLLKVMSDSYKLNIIDEYFMKIKRNQNLNDLSYDFKYSSNAGYNTYIFLEKIVKKIEIKKLKKESDDPEDNNNYLSKCLFFVKPQNTFALSKLTKNFFLQKEADRDSITQKINSLISKTDFFIYEMKLNTDSKVRNKVVSILNFYVLESINFLMIFIHQIILLVHFYKDFQLKDLLEYQFTIEEKYFRDTEDHGNIILGAIQLVYICIVILLWLRFKFIIHYNKALMTEYYNNSSLNEGENNSDKKFKTFFDEGGNPLYLGKFKFLTKLKIVIYDSILCNREIIVFFLNLLMIILFFIFRCAVFLAIPVLFIANLSNILFSIILSIKLRWYQLLLTLFYTYLLIYIFSWISFYFLDGAMQLEVFNAFYNNTTDFLNTTITENTYKENVCRTALQCLLASIDVGMRSGGGMGEALDKNSLKFPGKGNYMLRFFYNILFFIFIIMIMGNIFLGVIVDTFADLRDKENADENDKNNVCFICQMTRDDCMNENIDFEIHTRSDHKVWNYVYFLTYLRNGNPNDFNSLEFYVWKKVNIKDVNWIPIIQKSEDDE